MLIKLQAEYVLAYHFITHDLSVVARIAHRVAVMRHGHIVETGEVDEIFGEPKHAYTKLLLDSVPRTSRPMSVT